MTLPTRLLPLCGMSLLLVGSFACEAPNATITNVDGSEFGAGDDDDGAVGDDDDGGTTDSPTDPDPYPWSWEGERVFDFYWCQDAIGGNGIEVTEDPDYVEALAACGGCDEIYSVRHTPDTICFGNIQVIADSIRGLNRTTGVIYLIESTDQVYHAKELAQGEWTGDTLDYSYVGSMGYESYDVEGWVTTTPAQ